MSAPQSSQRLIDMEQLHFLPRYGCLQVSDASVHPEIRRDCLKYKVPRDHRMDEETDCLAVRIKSSVLRIMWCGSGNLRNLVG